MPTPFRLDVHHHILPPVYVQTLKRLGQDKSGGAPIPDWSAEQAIALMNSVGIEKAFASISSPGIYFGDQALTTELARQCNEFSARLVGQHPDRYNALGILPLPDASAALTELTYLMDTLALPGVILQASVGEQYQGDPAWEAVYAELDRRGAVVLLHPTTPPGSDVPRLNLPPFLVEFMIDTTRAIANLIYEGVLERYPNIRWIVAHAGGTAPYLVERFEMGETIMPHLREKAPKGARTYLRQLHYDTTTAANPTVFGALRTVADTDKILFGSDYPYMQEPLIRRTQQGLTTYDGFDERTKQAINRDNALRLF